MEVCQRNVRHRIVIWPFAHSTAEQESAVMALWGRYVSENCNWSGRCYDKFSYLESPLSLLLMNVKPFSYPNSLFLVTHLLYLGWLRGFIADYGVPLMVLVWTGVSYIPHDSVPKGIPRRLFSPNPWSPGAYDNWTVIKVLHKLNQTCETFRLYMLTIGAHQMFPTSMNRICPMCHSCT
jgi:hypothetical protein